MNYSKMMKLLGVPFVFLVSILSVEAHQMGGVGFGSGLLHPMMGLDHMLAMVAVGIIAARLGGKWIMVVPFTFVSSMIVGGIAAIEGVRLPLVDYGVALSVLVLGIVVAFNTKVSPYLAIVCVAFFAICHGHAHGEELPLITDPVLYTLGFVFSTTVLHVSGIVVAKKAYQTEKRTNALRYAGVAMALFGMVLLIGII